VDLPAFIQHYGLWAVAAGSFIEGETVVLLAGAAAHMGLLDLRWVIAIAALGAFAGDNLFFLLGRHFGPRLMQRYPSFATAVPRIEKLLARWSWGAVVALRFTYGLRMAGPAIIGTTRMPAWEFAAANALGAALWAALTAGLGFAAGRAVEPMLARIVDAEKVLLVLVVLLAALGLGVRYWRKRRVAARSAIVATPPST